jgi:hypothetical protein
MVKMVILFKTNFIYHDRNGNRIYFRDYVNSKICFQVTALKLLGFWVNFSVNNYLISYYNIQLPELLCLVSHYLK